MTQEEKRICASRLFREISYIDDRFIYEAETPYVRRRYGARMLRTLLIGAVSLSIAISVAVGAFVVGMMGGNKGKDEGDIFDEMQDVSGETTNGITLSARLSSLRDSTADAVVAKDEIDLFDGTPKVIWKYSDEEEYRTREISDGEYEKLVSVMTTGKGERVTASNEKNSTGVWIASGDGLVISPCLEQTAGNVGYGEIFDYVPEYEPSVELSKQICDYIS